MSVKPVYIYMHSYLVGLKTLFSRLNTSFVDFIHAAANTLARLLMHKLDNVIRIHTITYYITWVIRVCNVCQDNTILFENYNECFFFFFFLIVSAI